MPRVKSRNTAEAYKWYAAQGIPQIDAEIAEKGNFWMETNSVSIHRHMLYCNLFSKDVLISFSYGRRAMGKQV